MVKLRVPELATRLDAACDFIALAKIVCELGDLLDLLDSTIMLTDADGHPQICVDNVRDAGRGDRGVWASDGLIQRARDSHTPVTGFDAGLYTLAVPLIQPTRMVGSIRFRNLGPIDAELLVSLVALGTHVSVRLAQLGVSLDTPRDLPRLTRRQLDVGTLAARGLSNAEIASALGVSANTVKKHLKDVFARLALTNRTELAAWWGRAGCLERGPELVEGLTITRSPSRPSPSWRRGRAAGSSDR